MSQLFANNATSTLNAPIGSGSTTVVVGGGHGLLYPSPTGSDYFLATIQENVRVEIVKVTARSGDSMTIVRGQEGTVAAAFSAAATFEMRATAGTLNLLQSPSLLGVGLSSAIDPNSLKTQIGDAAAVNAYPSFFQGTGQLKIFSNNQSDAATGLAAGISNQMLLTTALDSFSEYTPFYAELHCTDTSSSNAYLYGADIEVFADHTSGTLSQVTGIFTNAYNGQTGTVGTVTGVSATAGIAHGGTVTTSIIGGSFAAFANPGVSQGTMYGVQATAQLASNGSSGGDLAGLYAQATHEGSSTSSANFYGVLASVSSLAASTGLTTSNHLMAGRYSMGNAGATAVGSVEGLHVDTAIGSGGATNLYGLYIDNQATATATNKYAWYYNSSSPSYMDSTGALTLGTPLAITSGGTGHNSANASLNALLPDQTGVTSGWLLSTNGTNSSWIAPPANAITSLTNDVTATGPGATVATIAAGAVTLAKMASLAANSIIGNNTGSPATPLALSTAQVKTLLGYYTSGDSPSFNTLTLSTALAIAQGGTGQVTANAAFNALAPSQASASGKYLTSNGTDTSWAAGVGGSGANTQVATWSGASTLTGTSTFLWTSNHLLVGTATDNGTNIVQIVDATTATPPVQLAVRNTNANGGAGVRYTTPSGDWYTYASASNPPAWKIDNGGNNYFQLYPDGAGNPNFTFTGGVAWARRHAVADTNYAISSASTDYLIAFTSLSAARTTTLPGAAGVGPGQMIIVKDESGSCSPTNTITILTSSGNTIDGASSYVINTPYGGVILYANSSEWFVKALGTIGGNMADGATAIGYQFNNVNSLANAAAKLANFKSGGTEKSFIDLNGYLNTATLHPINSKRLGEYVTITTADTAFLPIKLPAPLTQGTVSAAPTADSTLMMLKFLTGASSGNASGISGPYTSTRFGYSPRFGAVVRTDSVVTNQRIYIGLTDADLSAVTTLAGSNTNHYVAFRYDTTIGDTNWMAVSSDGTTASATSTGVAVAANTTYTLSIEYFTSGTVMFRINNATNPQVSKTSNLPTGATDIGIEVSLTTLTASAQSLYIAKVALEQN